MEGLCKFYKDRGRDYLSRSYDESRDNISVSDIWLCPKRMSFDMRSSSVSSEHIGDWLDSMNTQKSAARDDADYLVLSVICIAYRTDSFPWLSRIRKTDLELVLKKFQIGKAYQYCHTGLAGMAASPKHECEQGDLRTYSIFNSNMFSLAWSHDSTTHVSQGSCFADEWITSSMHSVLESQRNMAIHPMFLAAVIGLTVTLGFDQRLESDGVAIMEVERRTGYHAWPGMPSETAQGNYAVLSVRMSGVASQLAETKRTTKVLHEVIGFISQYSTQNANDYAGTDLILQKSEVAMKECLAILKSRLAMQEIQIDFLLHRSQIQLTAIFNLIAQKDANLNVTLARDSRTLASASKRDSSSMKTLAAVTVVFLPGSFISSLFAMPLLNWNVEKNDSLVNDKFWIYWAFTIPLTLLTIFIWLIWTHRQTLLHRAQDLKARKQFDNDIKDNKIGQEV